MARSVDQPAPRSRVAPALPLLVAAAAFIPFIPALTAGFSDFDDHGMLLETDRYRGLGPDNLAWMFTTTHMGHYQPLSWITFAIDYALWGLDPRGYHLTNLLLHAANAALVYLLAARLMAIARPTAPPAGVRLASAAGALLWAVHPLRVESAAWITERRDVLSAFFLLLTTLAYLVAFQPGRSAPASPRAYLLSLALLLLSVLAKAWGMTFFVVALILDVYPLRRLPGPPWRWLAPPARSVLIQKVPYAAIGLLVAAQAGRAQASGAFTTKTLAEWGVVDRLCQAVYGLRFYLQKGLWPTRLACLYEIPASLSPTEPRILISIAVVVLVAAVAVALRRRAPALATALAVFAVVVSPVLGFFQSGIQFVADRYAYIPHIPLFIALAAAIESLARRISAAAPRVALAAIGLAIALTLSILTWRQTRLWSNTEALFAHALSVGQDGPILRENYGRQLEVSGRRPEALAQFEAAIRLDPRYGEARFSRANVLKDLGRFADAEQEYRAASTLMPDGYRADVMLGTMYMTRLNRPRDAAAAFADAIAKVEAPGARTFSPQPYLLLAETLHELRDDRACRVYLEKAAQYPETRVKALEHLADLGPEAAPPPAPPPRR
jgi:tetratricopeptide (TPR) repeat protein